MNEQSQKQVHKMKKYISTFPLKSEEIILIHKDLDGMAEEAQNRGEPLEKVLGKSPREFCDELIYAIGGIKTPGGRKILRFVGAWYKLIAFLFLFGVIFDLSSAVVLTFGELFSEHPDILTGVRELLPGGIKAVILGIVYYIAGKRALQYSTDVSLSDKAMKWAVGMFVLEFGSWMYDFITEIGKEPMILLLLSLVFCCFSSVLFMIGAKRNCPHLEEESISIISYSEE